MKYLKKYEPFKESHLESERVPEDYKECEEYVISVLDKYKIKYITNGTWITLTDSVYTIYIGDDVNLDTGDVKTNINFMIPGGDRSSTYTTVTKSGFKSFLLKAFGVDLGEVMKRLNESTEDGVLIPDNDIVECENYIISVLDKYKVKYKKTGGRKSLFSDHGRKPFNFELLNAEYNIIIEEFVDENTADIVLIVFFKDKENPPALSDCYSTSSKYEFVDRLMKVHGIDMASVMKRMNEELNDDDIMKDPNTNHKEKEVLMNKVSLDDLNKYKSMKGRFDSIFSNIEEDIDSPTIFKLIDDNKFLKEYVSLLHKKRDLEVLKTLITDKENRLKELKKEIQDLNLSGESDPETKSGLNKQLSELIENIKDSKNKISDYSDVPNLFQKWDNQIIKLTRDLKQGISVLDSTLDDLR